MTGPTQRLSQVEFIALMGMVAATVAFSIDAMLPALPKIGAELSPDNLNHAQLIITSFVLGMGIGMFFTGPLSDAFGRKPVMVAGAFVYILASLAAWAAPTLEMMLAARVLQGLGAAGPRVVSLAMTRDLYAGRDMARIMSFVMIVFSIVPALAPTLGHFIILGFGWRAIFMAFIVFSGATMLWLMVRQPETLAPEQHRPLRVASLTAAARELLTHRTAALSIVVQMLTYGMLFMVLSATQQVFDITFGQGDYFHLWFGGIAVIAASGSFLNARIVGRFGMRAIIKATFIAQIGLSALMVVVTLSDAPYWLAFGTFVLWVQGNFFQAGLTIGNLSALAMEEMGHIAGLAASMMSAFATIGAVIIAAPIALAFDGTPLPMAAGELVVVCIALYLVTLIRRPGEA